MSVFIACRPVDLDLSNPFDAEIAASTIIYEGSVEQSCESCSRSVWVGPRGQAAQRLPGTTVVCFLCAVASGAADTIAHLGNPQTEQR